MSEAETERKIKEINRFFGGTLDVGVLQAILEVANNDVSQAIKFLQASQEQLSAEEYIDPMQENNGPRLPKNYMQKPRNWNIPQKKEVKLSKLKKKGNDIRILFFTETASVVDHIKLQDNPETYCVYIAVLLVLLHQNCELHFHSKWKILTASLATRHYDLVDYLMYQTSQFNLPEILKCVKILDMQRQIRQMNKKILKLEKCGAKRTTVNKVKTKIAELEKEAVPVEVFKTSVSGAMAKRIRKWAGKFTESELAFFSIQMPKKPWQELADIIHFSPRDFKLDHFLPVAFGAEPPEDSLISICTKLTVQNVEEAVSKHKIPFSYLRKNIPVLSTKVKQLVAKYERIDTLIWYYEEFTARGAKELIDDIIEERLKTGELPTFNYGKLLERILYFKMNDSKFYHYLIPVAQERLNAIDLPLEKPFYIYGDASYSMDVSIRTSTIIATFISCITEAKLMFFNNNSFEPKYQPKTVEQLLDIALNTKADGMTAPACILKDFYKNKTKCKIFLVVTDEIENVMSEGMYFAQMFYRYYTEVYPAKLVMVSFLDNPSQFESGRMTQALKSFGIEPIVFAMHSLRPDLQKLDKLVGLLSLETQAFLDSVKRVAKKAHKGGLPDAMSEMLRPKRSVELDENEDEGEDDEPKFEKPDEEEEELEAKKVGKLDLSDVPKNVAPLPESANSEEIPNEFLCPITRDVMKDPVVCSDGYTYEKEAILKWMKTKNTSPMTGAPLTETVVFPNHGLKSKLGEYLEEKKKKDQIEEKKDE